MIGDPTNSGGQHGQKSEEGEEGEERSEEDCQEDQEGFQEEEVTRLTKNAGGLMPARHTSHQDSLLPGADCKPEGSGRRKRVSARHQVKRPDRKIPSEFALSEKRSGRRTRHCLPAFFTRCGSLAPQFHRRPSPRWDLSLTCSPTPSFCLPARFGPRRHYPRRSPWTFDRRARGWTALRQRPNDLTTGIKRSLQSVRNRPRRITGRASMVIASPIARVNQSGRSAKIPVK
jgi:hypothetical protein